MSKAEKPPKRKVKTSYVSTIISIALVLFTLGLLEFFVLSAERIATHVKENITFSVFLSDDVSANQRQQLEKSLEGKPYVKKLTYISKEEALEILKNDIGEDVVDFMDENPLLASEEVFLKGAYAEPDSMRWIEADLKRYPQVKEVSYQPDLIDGVSRNTRKIGLVLVLFSVMLLVVVIALIFNTIRLAIYSKRFLIKTMQLVGATSSFIRRPFVGQGVINGIISAFIAMILLSGVIYVLVTNIPELKEPLGSTFYLILSSSILILGILISWIATSMAVRKFLRIESGDLY